jgi:hypothetical protein
MRAREAGGCKPPLLPTPYADVNGVLAELLHETRSVLGAALVGIYLTGSLALGDFDPQSSDLDVIVVTAHALDESKIAALQQWHARFAAGPSPWAGRIEIVYVPQAVLAAPLDIYAPNAQARYPQVEKERGFFVDHLEEGWLVHCYTVREHGVVVAGPDPRTLIPPVNPAALRRTVAQVPAMWLHDAQHDPTWLDWVGVHQHQAFVVLTLCRCLYTLDTGGVASKAAAAHWAQQTLDARWEGLIARALGKHDDAAPASVEDVAETVALVRETNARFGQHQG